jgi:hypothetical protein
MAMSVVSNGQSGEDHEAHSPGRVPHVRPTCPGVPWGVHGLKKMGRSPLRTLLLGEQTAATDENRRTWSESI